MIKIFWSVKLFTVAHKRRPVYLSPAYLFPRYSTTSPFSKCSRWYTSPFNAGHLYCEQSFTKLKIILSYIVWGKIDSVIWPIESLRNVRRNRTHTYCNSSYCSCQLWSYSIKLLLVDWMSVEREVFEHIDFKDIINQCAAVKDKRILGLKLSAEPRKWEKMQIALLISKLDWLNNIH